MEFGTSYLNCGGAGKIRLVCDQLLTLGYHTAILCDNDAPNKSVRRTSEAP